MNRDQIARDDFPEADKGYDRASVDAHLAAVAAWTAALEAQITALEVERDALRKSAALSAAHAKEEGRESEDPVPEPPEPVVAAAAQPDGAEEEAGKESSEDEVSARLVATKMALEGSDREEIVTRLKGEYELDDPETLAEDVLARLA